MKLGMLLLQDKKILKKGMKTGVTEHVFMPQC